MKLTLRHDETGYGVTAIEEAGIDGLVIDRPFVLLAGPNGAGKSAVLRGIRASIGLHGERGGKTLERDDPFITPRKIPALFDVSDLGWTDQRSYLFDSRAASTIADKATFDDDMLYHASLIAGGGARVSHGQFVRKTWWEALAWAAGDDARVHNPIAKRSDATTGTPTSPAAAPAERWLFVDEPETAIDSETLLIGLSVMLELAAVGTLRVFCASHSLLFAAGLADHPKVQTVDMGGGSPWMDTQRLALRLAGDPERLTGVGRDFVRRLRP